MALGNWFSLFGTCFFFFCILFSRSLAMILLQFKNWTWLTVPILSYQHFSVRTDESSCVRSIDTMIQKFLQPRPSESPDSIKKVETTKTTPREDQQWNNLLREYRPQWTGKLALLQNSSWPECNHYKCKQEFAKRKATSLKIGRRDFSWLSKIWCFTIRMSVTALSAFPLWDIMWCWRSNSIQNFSLWHHRVGRCSNSHWVAAETAKTS